jgi:hypothetical protein
LRKIDRQQKQKQRKKYKESSMQKNFSHFLKEKKKFKKYFKNNRKTIPTKIILLRMKNL